MSNNDNAFINWILTHDPEVEFAGAQQQQRTSNANPSDQIPLTNPELLPYILGDAAPSTAASTTNLPLLPSTMPGYSSAAAAMAPSSSPPAMAGAGGDSDEAKSTITFGGHKHRSDDEDEYLSESQLKMMTSKERRQLRNKISARKFRNRRKGLCAGELLIHMGR